MTKIPTKHVDKIITELKDYDNLKLQVKAYDSLTILYQQKIAVQNLQKENLQKQVFNLKESEKHHIAMSDELRSLYFKEQRRKENWRTAGLGFGAVLAFKIIIEAVL